MPGLNDWCPGKRKLFFFVRLITEEWSPVIRPSDHFAGSADQSAWLSAFTVDAGRGGVLGGL
jgi:hypothetical protein